AGGWGGGERQGVRVWRGGFAVGVLGAVAARLARDRYRVRRRHKSMLSGQPLSQPPLARQRTSSTTRQLANPAILPHGGLGAFAFKRCADLIEDDGIIDRSRDLPRIAVGDLLHPAAPDLSRAGFSE